MSKKIKEVKQKKESQKNKKNLKEEKKNNNIKKIIKSKITKQKLIYLLITFVDVSFIIYCAKHNYANYTKDIMEGYYYYVGDSKDLLFGKNYITIIFSIFIYFYILLSNKIFFQKKNTKKYMVILFIMILLINAILFFIFTKRIY